MDVKAMLVGNYGTDSSKMVSMAKEGEKANSEFRDLMEQASSAEAQKNPVKSERVEKKPEETDNKKECLEEDTFEQEKNNLLEQSSLIRNMTEVIPIIFAPENMVKEMPVCLEPPVALVEMVGKEAPTQQIVIVAEQLKPKDVLPVLEMQGKPMLEKEVQTSDLKTIEQKVEGHSQEIKSSDSSKAETKPLIQTMEKAQTFVEEKKLLDTKLTVQSEEKKIVLKEEPTVVLSTEKISEPQKEVVVIKVGENWQVPTGQKLAEKLGEKIVVNLKADNNEFHAILKPEGLGTIDVKMVVESGKILVSLICNNEKTKDLLNRNIASLAHMIEMNLGQEPVVTVSNQKESAQGQQQENFDGNGNGKGQYQEQDQSEKNKKDENSLEQDFVQRLRLGMMDQEEVIA